MFDELLAELKLAREGAEAGKYFTGLSHGGLALHIAGDIGVKYFEPAEKAKVGAADCDEATLAAIEAECNQPLKTKTSGPVGAGWQDYLQYLTIILEIIKKFRESRDK